MDVLRDRRVRRPRDDHAAVLPQVHSPMLRAMRLRSLRSNSAPGGFRFCSERVGDGRYPP